MSGNGEPTLEPTGEPTPPEPSAPQEPAAPPAAEPTGEEVVDHANQNGLTLEQAQAELRNVRAEAAGRRQELKPFKDAFEGWDPEVRDEWLTLAKQLANPAEQAKVAVRLQEIAEKIQKADPNSRLTPTGDPDPKHRPLTMGEFEEMQARQQQEQSQAQAVAQIEAEATSLGFAPLNEDGSVNRQYTWLLDFAQDPDVAGDLTKAKAKLEEYQSGVMQRLAEQKQQQAGAWPGGPEIPSAPAADPEGGAPKTFRDATRAARAYIASKAGE